MVDFQLDRLENFFFQPGEMIRRILCMWRQTKARAQMKRNVIRLQQFSRIHFSKWMGQSTYINQMRVPRPSVLRSNYCSCPIFRFICYFLFLLPRKEYHGMYFGTENFATITYKT